MARRYENIKTRKTISGKIGYLPTTYPSVALSNEDYYIIAREQDRMDLLANDFYGDPTLWWVIANANGSLSRDSLTPPIGTQLRIPSNPTPTLSAFKNINPPSTVASTAETSNTVSTPSSGVSGGGGGASGGRY